MLYSKQQITEKIDELKEYCKENSPYKNMDGSFDWDSFFVPLYATVNSYFSANMDDVSDEVNYLIQAMYCDILRRTTKYENDDQFNFNISTAYPNGYSDVRNCFYDFSHIMNTNNETFLNSCTLDITTFAIESELLDTWISSIATGHASDLQKVTTLAEWCANSGSCCDLINLLEERGKLLEMKGTRENAKIIYIDRHVLDVIRWFSLSSYIPTYYEGV